MKKMKAEEFEKIMSDCGYDFEVFGYEGILNYISILAKEASITYYNESHVLAAVTKNTYDVIYASLKERGYYDN